MPPIIHLMRHGQGYHSAEVTENGHLVRDPHLTEKGKEQCRQRCEAFDRHDKIELLVASPLRRTIQTCQIAFAPCITQHNLKITVLPIAEEVSSNPEDTGSPPAILREEFNDGTVNFDALTDEWYVHKGDFSSEPKVVMARALKLRKWLRDREEREIGVVAHGFYNHFVTGEVDEEGEQTTPMWDEAELRTYEFKENDFDGTAMLYETVESLKRRGAK